MDGRLIISRKDEENAHSDEGKKRGSEARAAEEEGRGMGRNRAAIIRIGEVLRAYRCESLQSTEGVSTGTRLTKAERERGAKTIAIIREGLNLYNKIRRWLPLPGADMTRLFLLEKEWLSHRVCE